MSESAAHALHPAGAFIRALRPRQWLKNLLVVAAPLAAGALGAFDVQWRAAALFVLLCAVSSAGYLVNDIRDVDYDRRHPVKRLRPIASGAVAVRLALTAALAMFLLGHALALFLFGVDVFVALLAYSAVSLVYSFGAKSVAGVELLLVSTGFVIRAVLGGLGTGTRLSAWFLVFIGVAALLVVVGKRQSELVRIGAPDAASRAALRRYSPGYLNGIAWLCLVTAVGSYIMWAVTRGIQDDEPILLMASVIPLSMSMWRYRELIAAGRAEAPEEALLADRVIVISSAVWLAAFSCSVAIGP